MMFKKILSILILVFFFSYHGFAYGVSPAVSISVKPSSSTSAYPTETLIDKLKKIENLKEKIATKVAQIRQKEKKALFGLVKKIDKSTVTLTSKQNDSSFALTEDTIVYDLSSGMRLDSNQSKIKEDGHISVFGYTDETQSVLSAKYIYIEKPPIHLSGKIADIDKSNYALTLKTNEGENIIDIETTSKIFFYSPGKNLVKGGFSKFKMGDMVQLFGKFNAKESNRFSATRMIDFSLANTSPTPLKETTPTSSPSAKPKPISKSTS